MQINCFYLFHLHSSSLFPPKKSNLQDNFVHIGYIHKATKGMEHLPYEEMLR